MLWSSFKRVFWIFEGRLLKKTIASLRQVSLMFLMNRVIIFPGIIAKHNWILLSSHLYGPDVSNLDGWMVEQQNK